MRSLRLSLVAWCLSVLLGGPVLAASYQEVGLASRKVDPIRYRPDKAAPSFGEHPYDVRDLRPGANLLGVSLPWAHLQRVGLVGDDLRGTDLMYVDCFQA